MKMVQIDEDGIFIYDQQGNEIVSWNTDEFKEDETVCLSALNAVKIFYEEGELALKEYIRH